MKIRIPHRYILVTPISTEEMVGGFEVSHMISDNRYTRAKVEYTSDHPDVLLKVGDIITYDKVAGKDFYAMDNSTYKVLSWEDVLTIEQ